ncbi:MAG: sel1 repeat family protein, partial [Phycisphaeraceae bacterium]|nr:sel1 repeat family protein [Phycisphaeraceae bacterium]
RNRKTAFSWYLKAAQQGDMEAQTLVGQCLLNGEGTDPDKSQAIEWLNMAVDQGNEEAIELLNSLL